MNTLKPWIEVVSLHPDVTSEHFSEDIFALDLGPLADGDPHVPAVYRDPEQFFRASYLTAGLRSLLEDVLSRLAGGSGSRVLKLVTPFGGGKSHTLAALLHAGRSRKALDVIPEGKTLPKPPTARWAVFDGQFFDATTGRTVDGVHIQTLWGWIAWSLGGREAYELVRAQDEARVATGGDVILALLKKGPNLILLDEMLQYLISAGGIKIHDTTLRDETMTFLQRLTVTVTNTDNTALVFSLQSSKRESLEYSNLLQTVDHLASRKDQRREPVEKDEVLAVIQRRLLAKLPTADEATPAATAYQEIVTQMRRAYSRSGAESLEAEADGIALRDRIRAAYPFHPALIDIMRERWAAIPDFQRTRGALRFLAACLRATQRMNKSRALLGPGDVPMQDNEVRQAFFKEVGQQADFQAVLEHDLIGANARARRIDDRRAREYPAEGAKRPATRLATAILMYSFGGLQREGVGEAELLPPGVTEPELLNACVGPDLDSTTALACLKELKEQCLYLHFDGARYCFKKDPNVTLLVEQEADMVARDERTVRQKIQEMLEERLDGAREAIVWPAQSGDITDKEATFFIAYLPLEFAGKSKAMRETQARELLEKCGEKPRSYRNGLALAIPAAEQVEILRRSVRYLVAIERLSGKAKQLNLTDEQRGQLREREATERAAVESAFMRLYLEVWFPRAEEGGIGIDAVSLGGRSLQTTLGDKKTAPVHKRVMELITEVQKRVHRSLTPVKLVEGFNLGCGPSPRPGIATASVVEGLYSFLGYPRLTSPSAVAETVRKGVQEKRFGYISGPIPELGEDGKYKVPHTRVRFGVSMSADEVDLDSGFLMIPDAIPQPPAIEAPPQPPDGETPAERPDTEQPPQPEPSQTPHTGRQRVVELSFKVDRDQLYTAWNAIGNLTDMAGRISVTVRGESEEGFDRSRLENGVLEPLREADLIE